MISDTIDARGYSCPQPVMMTLNAINRVKKGALVIMVDTDTAKENVSRAAKARGWEVAGIQAEGNGYKIIIRKEG